MPTSIPGVMIVEDNPETLHRLSQAISGSGTTWLAGTATRGKDAMQRMSSVRPNVLLVDVGLPDISGVEVIKHAAQKIPECDIMVLTVFSDEPVVVSCMESGATGYILKDCEEEDLISHILALRAGGSPISPAIARTVLRRMLASSGSDNTGEWKISNTPTNGPLTAREISILKLMSRGYTYGEIAGQLSISIHTVSSHVKNIYRKLAVHSSAAAVMKASTLRLLLGEHPPDDDAPSAANIRSR